MAALPLDARGEPPAYLWVAAGPNPRRREVAAAETANRREAAWAARSGRRVVARAVGCRGTRSAEPTEVSGVLGRGRAGRSGERGREQGGGRSRGSPRRRRRRGPGVRALGGGRRRRPEPSPLGPPGRLWVWTPRLWPIRRVPSWGARPWGRRRGGTGPCRLPAELWLGSGPRDKRSAPPVTPTAVVSGS